jgi:hypothetical protein
LKIVLNREIRAHLIDLLERQTALGIIGKLGHSARIAVEVGRQLPAPSRPDPDRRTSRFANSPRRQSRLAER